MVKSPFGNDILEVKKAYFWVSESAKMAFFKDPEGLKISKQSQNSQKMSKNHPKSDQKVVKNHQKMVKNPIKNQSKMAFLGSKKHTFGCPKSIKSAIFRHDEGQNHQNRKILKTESKSIAKS